VSTLPAHHHPQERSRRLAPPSACRGAGIRTTRGSVERLGLHLWSDGLVSSDHASLASALTPTGGGCSLADCHSRRRLHPISREFPRPCRTSTSTEEHGSGWAAQRAGATPDVGRREEPAERVLLASTPVPSRGPGLQSSQRRSSRHRQHAGAREFARHGVPSNGSAQALAWGPRGGERRSMLLVRDALCCRN